jgi:hypothetical protein
VVSDSRRRTIVRALVVGSIVFHAAWWPIAWPRNWVEHVFARRVYPAISEVGSRVSGIVPVPIAPVLGIAGILWLALRPFRRARRSTAPTRPRWRCVAGGALNAAGAASVLGASFVAVWGANYRRLPIEDILGLGRHEPASPALVASRALDWIIDELPDVGARDRVLAETSVRESLERFLEFELDGRVPRLPRRVKSVPAGTLLAFGTTGMLCPPFAEALVDSGQTDVARIPTAAHEWAHTAGFAGEADAELVGVLAARRASDPFARYAVSLRIYSDVSRLLSKEERIALQSRLPEAARRDLEESARRGRRFRVRALDRAQKRFHDAFLRSQGVRHGIRDYDRAVELLLRAFAAGRLEAP